jgi:hypothetical protein
MFCNLLKHVSLCVFLISKELWLYRRVLYCGTLRKMYPGNSTCICTELPNTTACPQFTGSVHASKWLGCCKMHELCTLSTGWSAINVVVLLQKPFGCRHDTNALLYPPYIVIVCQQKLTYKNCYNLCLDILDKINVLCIVKYTAGNCAARHSTVSLV